MKNRSTRKKKIPVPKTKSLIRKSNSNGTLKTSSNNSKMKKKSQTKNQSPKRPSLFTSKANSPLKPLTKKHRAKISNFMKATRIKKSLSNKILMVSSTCTKSLSTKDLRPKSRRKEKEILRRSKNSSTNPKTKREERQTRKSQN